MTTAAVAATRNAPETNSRKTQVTVSRAIHVLSTEDEPRQVVSHRDRACRNLESEENTAFSDAFGTSPEFWINLQSNFDLWEAQQEHKKQKKIA